MVFDVDKLKEPVEAGDANAVLNLLAPALVAGQPLWWCEEHKNSGWPGFSDNPPSEFQCAVGALDADQSGEDCRMVEGWWMPTGKVDGV